MSKLNELILTKKTSDFILKFNQDQISDFEVHNYITLSSNFSEDIYLFLIEKRQNNTVFFVDILTILKNLIVNDFKKGFLETFVYLKDYDLKRFTSQMIKEKKAINIFYFQKLVEKLEKKEVFDNFFQEKLLQRSVFLLEYDLLFFLIKDKKIKIDIKNDIFDQFLQYVYLHKNDKKWPILFLLLDYNLKIDINKFDKDDYLYFVKTKNLKALELI